MTHAVECMILMMRSGGTMDSAAPALQFPTAHVAAVDAIGLVKAKAACDRLAEAGGTVERDGKSGTRLTITVPALPTDDTAARAAS